MICEWMDHGNINEFIERNEGVNRVQLVSDGALPCGNYCNLLIQLVDAANGLEYMHSLHMVHGDLKGVLLNRQPNGQLLITLTRQIYSSTKILMPASLILVSRPSSAQRVVLQSMLLRPLWLWRYLSCHLLLVGLFGG